MTAAVLELTGVGKRFGSVMALSQVNFHVAPAEVVGLVGDNGAGKSTLVKTMAGIHVPDEGGIRFLGQPVRIREPSDSTGLGIFTVYQDLALCDNLDVVANLYFGREQAMGPFRALQEEAMERRATDVLSTLGIRLPSLRTPIALLSGGQRQSVAVARSVMWDAKVVLLDEPTSALGVTQSRLVLDLVARLRDQGLGVVLISHNLADVFNCCDRIVVLRLGRVAASFDVRATSPEEVVAAITGADANRTDAP